METNSSEIIKSAASYVADLLNGRKPMVGIVLGSGLGGLADLIEDSTVIPYSSVPDFPVSTAIGHKGNFILGKLGGKDVVAMQGRLHYYEGYPMSLVTLPIRVMMKLGISHLFVSNAAGGINLDYRIGDLMIIKDHINLLPNPLIGPNLDEFGPRFPDMTRTYDRDLRGMALEICSRLGYGVHEGVYLGDTGPSYETPAEYKFYRIIGADAVGMSTIPEVIVARHGGIKIFGMSVITNEAHDDYPDGFKNNGDDVVKAANAAAGKMNNLLIEMISQL